MKFRGIFNVECNMISIYTNFQFYSLESKEDIQIAQVCFFLLLGRAIATDTQNFLLEAIQQSTGRVTVYSEINRPWRDQKLSSLEMIGGKFSLSGFRDLPKVKTFSQSFQHKVEKQITITAIDTHYSAHKNVTSLWIWNYMGNDS